MAIGLAFCFWQDGDAQGPKDFVAYAKAHGGQMGDGDASIAAMQPLVEYLMNTVSASVSKGTLPTHPGNPNPEAPTGTKLADPLTGFIAHETMLGILLDGLMHGSLLSLELDVVKDQVRRQPDNALYQFILHKFTDGDQTAAVTILERTNLFPAGRLPTSADRSTYYLWQRDEETADWQPDSTRAPVTFSGTDLTFVSALLAGDVREVHQN